MAAQDLLYNPPQDLLYNPRARRHAWDGTAALEEERVQAHLEGLAGGDSTLTITYMLAFFAVPHSGCQSVVTAM